MKPLKTADQYRKSELAQIHIAKVQLALGDDEYREILRVVTGKSSSKDLDWKERKSLLDHFKKIGFKVKAKTGRAAPSVRTDKAALVEKIKAQLTEANRPWEYADALAKRICKVDRVEWCTVHQLVKIVAALTYDANRHGRDSR